MTLSLLCGVSLPAAEHTASASKSPPAKPDAARADAPKPRARADDGSRARSNRTPVVVDINTASEAALSAHPMIGATAAKAIIAARPFSSLDDLSRIEGLSAERIEQIRVAVHAPALAAESPAPDRIGPERSKVDVNTADRATLEALPSVGTDLVDVIMRARPFARIDDLDRIQGISAERLEQLRTELMVATPGQALAGKTRKKDSRPTSRQERELAPTGRAPAEPRR